MIHMALIGSLRARAIAPRAPAPRMLTALQRATLLQRLPAFRDSEFTSLPLGFLGAYKVHNSVKFASGPWHGRPARGEDINSVMAGKAMPRLGGLGGMRIARYRDRKSVV